ncbi:hypothetical protein CIL05_09700 [Virgibacillus profundi]|uniref:DUF485 domain-containing protein n=1 Tax=Virgibacillus profundi TaxID=2024555 RepID=A0A2A2IE46_9BACI|nr:DUF485 domain-containing protein [Virgibacillus profundi]PAV29638.1 hypothetical protein CIL05_09700 [Virgibacillus profundi]PXY53810.1 DUF485 domain-containing protein [Virgibacillus profundi]
MDETFQKLMQEKKRFLLPALIFLFIFYFMLPLSLIFFPEAMNQTSFVSGVTWGWLYAFMQIPMTWTMAWIYHIKSKRFDRIVEEIKREELL